MACPSFPMPAVCTEPPALSAFLPLPKLAEFRWVADEKSPLHWWVLYQHGSISGTSESKQASCRDMHNTGPLLTRPFLPTSPGPLHTHAQTRTHTHTPPPLCSHPSDLSCNVPSTGRPPLTTPLGMLSCRICLSQHLCL